jgi:hypothetical protein
LRAGGLRAGVLRAGVEVRLVVDVREVVAVDRAEPDRGRAEVFVAIPAP